MPTAGGPTHPDGRAPRRGLFASKAREPPRHSRRPTMQPSGREMQGGGGGQDNFFDQMLSTLLATWADLGSGKSPWELPAGASARAVSEDTAALDEPALHASRLRHHQIGAGEKPLMLHLSDLHGLGAGDDAWFMPPLLFTQHRARNDMDVAFKSPNAAGGDRELYNGFGAARMHTAAVHQPSFGQVRHRTFKFRWDAYRRHASAALRAGMPPDRAGGSTTCTSSRSSSPASWQDSMIFQHDLADPIRRLNSPWRLL